MSLERPSRRVTLALVLAAAVSLVLNAVFGVVRIALPDGGTAGQATDTVALPAPNTDGDVSVEAALAARRSRREYGSDPLSRRDLGQVLWAAQGITRRVSGYRTAPSAGARYPLELFVVVGTSGVEGVDPGVYQYRPRRHELVRRRSGDVQSALRRAAVDQASVEAAAVDLVVCAVDARTTEKYGQRGRQRYVPMEAGHVGQNVYLQAESLGLGTVAVGAFADDRVRELVGAPADHRPLYVIPVGTRA
ncbi:SagB/ThcOx family dehydrogenase [Salinigranum halophilum]|jgi:SagB-type dehydrogenase family enzyme|uniref:SagB/ThcOx family dehydrogenase n=1 Tax=Salinigranum halophilum TaxID=2565931 RepID=UPI00115CFDCE|nr:SagB/ThcOx family dehydrogenase [Salinigranum halophilum]